MGKTNIRRKSEQETSPQKGLWGGCSVYVTLTVLSGLGATGRMADILHNTASCPANAKVTAGLPRMNSKRAFVKTDWWICMCGTSGFSQHNTSPPLSLVGEIPIL